MKRWIPPLLLAAGLAIAGTINVTDVYVFQALFRPWSRTTAQLPTASAWTGYVAYDSTKGALSVSNGSAWVSSPFNALTGSRSYVFPALGSAVLQTTCSESFAITVTGAAIGDSCVGSTNLGMDGGLGLSTEASLDCRVSSANSAMVKLCVHFTDGGTYTLGDAGIYARVFH